MIARLSNNSIKTYTGKAHHPHRVWPLSVLHQPPFGGPYHLQEGIYGGKPAYLPFVPISLHVCKEPLCIHCLYEPDGRRVLLGNGTQALLVCIEGVPKAGAYVAQVGTSYYAGLLGICGHCL